jgi:hypothetical protein
MVKMKCVARYIPTIGVVASRTINFELLPVGVLCMQANSQKEKTKYEASVKQKMILRYIDLVLK